MGLLCYRWYYPPTASAPLPDLCIDHLLLLPPPNTSSLPPRSRPWFRSLNLDQEGEASYCPPPTIYHHLPSSTSASILLPPTTYYNHLLSSSPIIISYHHLLSSPPTTTSYHLLPPPTTSFLPTRYIYLNLPGKKAQSSSLLTATK